MANSESPFFISGEKTVSATGTAEALVAATQKAWSVTIIAKAGNTNQLYVGGSDVATTTNDGLDAGESITLTVHQGQPAFDLNDIFLDVDTNGEGCDFYAIKA